MKYIDAVNEYVNDLKTKKYSKDTIRQRKSILTHWFSYVLSMFHSESITEIKKIEKPIFFNNNRLYTCTKKVRIEAVEHFLDSIDRSNKIIYLNLSSLYEDYKKSFLLSDINKNALRYFFRAIGFSLNIGKLTKNVFNECLVLLDSLRNNRTILIIRAFLIFCYEKQWISFNPYPEIKKKYYQCYEEWFIGDYQGVFREYLKKYIDYMRYERNLADGGNDFRIRKLRTFTQYMDEKKIKKPDLKSIKDFLAIKEKASKKIQKKTLYYYLFEITKFLGYLTDRNYIKSNPAIDLKIKYLENYQKDVLTDNEVNQVLQYFDDEIYKYQSPENLQSMQRYFRLVRDNLIFLMFVLLGLRLAELAGIKLENIDTTKKCIEITGKGNYTVNGKITEMKIDPYLWSSLKAYLSIKKYSGQPYLFITWYGSNLSTQRINAIVHKRIKEAGINKRISPHRLRATCASLYIKKGVDPLTLKNIMRHNSISTTMNYYAQLTENELRKVWKETNPLKGVFDED